MSSLKVESFYHTIGVPYIAMRALADSAGRAAECRAILPSRSHQHERGFSAPRHALRLREAAACALPESRGAVIDDALYQRQPYRTADFWRESG